MTGKIRYFLISGLLLMFVIFSCKKDKVEDCCSTGSANCQDIQEVKKYFYFKPGSWWVYQEENSGARDSVYVTSAANDPTNYNFEIFLHSTYEGYNYIFWPVFAYGSPECKESGNICTSCVRIKRTKTKPGDFVGEQICFFHVAKQGDFVYSANIYYTNNKIIVEDVMSSFQVLNYQFNKTYKIHELNTFTEGKQATNHYFSKGVGLVKKELLDSNKVWNLVNYHIE